MSLTGHKDIISTVIRMNHQHYAPAGTGFANVCPVRDNMLVETYATHTIPRPVRDGMLVEKFYVS
ncbi:MAG: hypothetical protein LBR97_01685 [Dysgonamonadaceae bacterium]|nr:hypothetical protein [Dysgonamonadaceae bacterium]